MKKTTKKSKKNGKILIILSIFAVIFAVIFIFNNLNKNSISGYEILGENFTDGSQNITSDSGIPTENPQEILAENQTPSENFDNIIDNASANITVNLENSTENEQNLNETIEISNETLQNETSLGQNQTEISNETNETSQNLTKNETSEQNLTENTTETQNVLKNIRLEMVYPQKMTRGETVTIRAIASNIDALAADNVAIDWTIPAGFSLISGDIRHFCGSIAPNDSCIGEIVLSTNATTPIGLNTINAMVNYE